MDADEIKLIVESVIDTKLGHLKVPSEDHFAGHQKLERIDHSDVDFLIAARKLVQAIKDTFWKTLIKAVVVFFLSLVSGGIYFYFKFKGHIPH